MAVPFAPIQTNFTAGEWSPRLDARVDVGKYLNACRRLENMVIHPHGGVSRRSGTRHVAAVKDSADATIVVGFEFGLLQAYVIEFGDQYVRFFMDEGAIESTPGTPYEVATAYTSAELAELSFVQSFDVLYVFHPDHATAKLTRTAHDAWTIADVDWKDGPYLEVNATATTLALSGTSGSVTVTASSVTGINGGAGFSADDVGRLIRFQDAATNWTWLEVTAFTDTTHVTATIRGPAASAGTARTTWRLGAWSVETGFAACGTFWDDRLYLGYSDTQPQTVWGSQPQDFENMAPSDPDGTVADDSAVVFTLNTDRACAIRWLSPAAALVIGTTGGEFTLRASNADEAVTPTNVRVKRQTTRPTTAIPPAQVDDVTLFVQRSGRKVREFVYRFDSDSYHSPDMTLLAEHVTKGGITAAAYGDEPDSIYWAARADGQLLGMTYERAQEVVGWHRHILGGSFGAGAAAVESLCVITSPDGSHSQLWMVVKRTINGGTTRHVEFMEDAFGEDDALADAFFVDAGLTYDGSPATVISGLDHLEGETVAILADGAAHPDKVVASGAVTLDRAASKVHVGLGYMSKVQTMRWDPPMRDGTAQGRIARIHEIGIRFWNTLGAKYGYDEDSLDTIPFRSSADEMDAPPARFTGDKVVKFPAGHKRDLRVIVRQDQPLPMTVLGLMPKGMAADG